MGYVQTPATLDARQEPITDKCRLCALPVFEAHSGIVEVTQHGSLIRKAVLYGLHAPCADDWAYSEMKRLREVYRDQPEFEYVFRVEAVP